MEPTRAQKVALQGIADCDRGDGWATMWPCNVTRRALLKCKEAGWLEDSTKSDNRLPCTAYRLTQSGWSALIGGRAKGPTAVMLRTLLSGPKEVADFELEALKLAERMGWIEDSPTPPGGFWRVIRITDRGKAAIATRSGQPTSGKG